MRNAILPVTRTKHRGDHRAHTTQRVLYYTFCVPLRCARDVEKSESPTLCRTAVVWKYRSRNTTWHTFRTYRIRRSKNRKPFTENRRLCPETRSYTKSLAEQWKTREKKNFLKKFLVRRRSTARNAHKKGGEFARKFFYRSSHTRFANHKSSYSIFRSFVRPFAARGVLRRFFSSTLRIKRFTHACIRS